MHVRSSSLIEVSNLILTEVSILTLSSGIAELCKCSVEKPTRPSARNHSAGREKSDLYCLRNGSSPTPT